MVDFYYKTCKIQLHMIFIIATLVIAFSYTVFLALFNGIFYTLFLIIFNKTGTVDIEHERLANAMSSSNLRIAIPVLSIILTFFLSYVLYFLFKNYNFGYSISASVGAGLALCQVVADIIPKIISLILNKK